MQLEILERTGKCGWGGSQNMLVDKCTGLPPCSLDALTFTHSLPRTSHLTVLCCSVEFLFLHPPQRVDECCKYMLRVYWCALGREPQFFYYGKETTVWVLLGSSGFQRWKG